MTNTCLSNNMEEKVVSTYWMPLRKTDDTGVWKRKP